MVGFVLPKSRLGRERGHGAKRGTAIDEAIDNTTVWSVTGPLLAGHRRVLRRPFRSPHHTAASESQPLPFLGRFGGFLRFSGVSRHFA